MRSASTTRIRTTLPKAPGAAPLAALLQERDRMAGREVGVILCGGNIDAPWMRTILGGGVPDA